MWGLSKEMADNSCFTTQFFWKLYYARDRTSRISTLGIYENPGRMGIIMSSPYITIKRGVKCMPLLQITGYCFILVMHVSLRNDVIHKFCPISIPVAKEFLADRPFGHLNMLHKHRGNCAISTSC